MFSLHILLAFLGVFYLSPHIMSLPAQPIGFHSGLIALNESTKAFPWGPKTFLIPSSSMTLRLQKGRNLGQLPLQTLINSAIDFIANQVNIYGESATCNDIPFRYDVGEGTEIVIWYIIHPFTWGQLATVLHGLQLYILDGKRYRAYHFEIGGLDSLDGYPWFGWGDIGLSVAAHT